MAEIISKNVPNAKAPSSCKIVRSACENDFMSRAILVRKEIATISHVNKTISPKRVDLRFE